MQMYKIMPFVLVILLICGCADGAAIAVRPDAMPVLTAEADARAQTEQAHAELPPEPPHETARVTFTAAGDNVIHPSLIMTASRHAGGAGHDFLPIYADAADYIASFDVAFINQETLTGGDALGFTGYPRFNTPQQVCRDLKTLGFDVVNIANNHMADKGAAGLSGTIDYWESPEMSGVTLIGGYRDREDYDRVRVTEHEGLRVAWLSYTYSTNGQSLPASSELVLPYIDDEDIRRQCKIAEELADITIVSVHWGDENMPVNEEQRRVAKLMAEQGVDVILGHHPHILQPAEWIEAGEQRTLCIYSLGNLVSGMAGWKNMVGGFLEFEIVKRSDGAVWVENAAFVPTVLYYAPAGLRHHLYFLEDIPEKLVENHGTGAIYGSYATKADMLKLVETTMGDFLRMEIDAKNDNE